MTRAAAACAARERHEAARVGVVSTAGAAMAVGSSIVKALPSPTRYGALFMNRQDEALRRQVYARLVAEPRTFVRDVALPWLHPQGAAHLRFAERPGFPIRILVGDADRATPPRVQRALAARVPGAALDVLPAPDHYGMIEGVGAGDVLARALAFLKD